MLARHLLSPLLLAAFFGSGCSGFGDSRRDVTSSPELRGISTEEALAEVDIVGQTLRGLYGPLRFKEKTLGFDLEKEMTAAKATIRAATAEADRIGAIVELLDKLDDGHVGLQYDAQGSDSVDQFLFLEVLPVEGKFVIHKGPPGMTRGDLVVSIDGLSPAEIERELRSFPYGTSATRKQFVALYMTYRPFFLPAAVRPKHDAATLVLERPNGTTYQVSMPWTKRPGRTTLSERTPERTTAMGSSRRTLDRSFASADAQALVSPRLGFFDHGSEFPLFLTEPVKTTFSMTEVRPQPSTLAEVGITEDTNVIFHAYKYRHAGKVVLLVRVPHFSPPESNPDDQISWMAALLRDNLVTTDLPPDVLVLDETHNSGGYASMVIGLGSLLTDKPIGSFVQANHADRRWFKALLAGADESTNPTEKAEWFDRASGIEQALDRGDWLAPPVPLTGPSWGRFGDPESAGRTTVAPHPFVQWTKPVLVLADELCASGGDFFPAIVQKNGLGKVFGAQTWGAGGNVEEVANLPYSNATLFLTRGMAAIHRMDGEPLGETDFLENHGVMPDYPYAPTLADYRSGYLDYVQKFSDVAVSLQR